MGEALGATPTGSPSYRMLKSKVLLVPDLHQDHRFLERIISAEPIEQFKKVVLMGDYFDGRDPGTKGPLATRAMARLIRQLEARLGPRLILLWGNHDLGYYLYRRSLEMPDGLRWTWADHRSILGIGPESQACAREVAEEWPLGFWMKLRPFTLLEGYLISHAGLHPRFYREAAASISEGLRQVNGRWMRAVGSLVGQGILDPILDAGEARGGAAGSVGGPLWLDWNREFQCGLPVGQIVGHTALCSTRQCGRSHCIDFQQSAYAIIGEELEIRGI